METTPRCHLSKALGHAIDADNLDQISPDEIPSVTAEVGWALSAINLRIKAAAAAASRNEQAPLVDELAELQEQRCFLAGLHQLLLQLRGHYRRQETERQQAAAAERTSSIRDLSHYFQQVVRNESRPADYQRWVLQAEMRQNADLNRAQQKGAAAQAVGR